MIGLGCIVLHHYAQAATQLISAARDGDIATLKRLLNVTDEVGVSFEQCLALCA